MIASTRSRRPTSGNQAPGGSTMARTLRADGDPVVHGAAGGRSGRGPHGVDGAEHGAERGAEDVGVGADPPVGVAGAGAGLHVGRGRGGGARPEGVLVVV